MNIHSTIREWNSNQQRIILRVDLNVPLSDGAVYNDFRLESIRPTLDFLLSQQAIIVLLTHLGRPHGYDKSLSTRLLMPWFEKKNYPIIFASNFDNVPTQLAGPHLILFENLRFFPGEQSHDFTFAQQLKTLGSYYIDDAFATMHRTDTSITLLPSLFTQTHRSIGFLVEKEIKMLTALIHKPNKPECIIMGGAKVHDKIPAIERLLDIATTIILCPAICFSFLKAMGKNVGKSLVDEESLTHCKRIIKKAEKNNVELLFPIDYQIAIDSLQGPLSIVNANQIPDNAIGISVGPQTVNLFAQKIENSKTIFFNGAIGFFEKPETLTGMCGLLKAMGKNNGTTIIAGGDASAAAFYCKIADSISHISTGGGAALAFISGTKLPGLVALEIPNK